MISMKKLEIKISEINDIFQAVFAIYCDSHWKSVENKKICEYLNL
jgi:hypothetical protein